MQINHFPFVYYYNFWYKSIDFEICNLLTYLQYNNNIQGFTCPFPKMNYQIRRDGWFIITSYSVLNHVKIIVPYQLQLSVRFIFRRWFIIRNFFLIVCFCIRIIIIILVTLGVKVRLLMFLFLFFICVQFTASHKEKMIYICFLHNAEDKVFHIAYYYFYEQNFGLVSTSRRLNIILAWTGYSLWMSVILHFLFFLCHICVEGRNVIT